MTEAIQAMVGSIVVVGEMDHCALFHSGLDLKATLMNVQDCIIQGLYELKFGRGSN